MAFNIAVLQGQRPIAEEIEEARNSLLHSQRQEKFELVLNMARTSLGDASSPGSLPCGSAPLLGSDGKELSVFPRNTGGGQGEAAGSSLEGLATSAFLQAMAHSSGGMVLRAYEKAGRSGSGLSRAASLQEGRAVALPRNPSMPPSRSLAVQGGHEDDRLGALSAQFESADAGAGAIGYDRNGGTSYGIFQIASRQGTMKLFLDFLDQHAPQWAVRLKSAGPADTGSTQGSMPREWNRIAQEDPVGFEKLQEDFIKESHYNAALDEIRQKTGMDAKEQSGALQQVIWSTAVQHGPRGAASVFSEAVDRIRTSGKELTEKQLIENVYALRASKFGLSSPQVRAAVQARFKQEKGMALAMLGGDHSNG